MAEDVEKLKQRRPLLDYLQRQNWVAQPAGYDSEFVGLCPLHRREQKFRQKLRVREPPGGYPVVSIRGEVPGQSRLRDLDNGNRDTNLARRIRLVTLRSGLKSASQM
jgi:hypothetical protein